jgi:pimeloyl-ACP methyl ester carboxylesterase
MDSCLTPDGRSVEFMTAGDAHGDTVVYIHGTPGSGLLMQSFSDLATARGLFLVGITRAGYGGSTRRAARSVADFVEDVRCVLDHLGRSSYVAIGWSGGGPHAIACAAVDPQCRQAISLAGVAPVVDDFDWTEGMGPENVEEFARAREGGPDYEAAMEEAARELSTMTADNIIEIFGGLISPVDAASMSDPAVRASMAESLAYGVSAGAGGFIDDDQAFLRDWGFSLADVETPVTLFYGDEDLMVPATHGHYLAKTLPQVTAHHLPEEGHISIPLTFLPQIFDAIISA